jgi:hypothetical protein
MIAPGVRVIYSIGSQQDSEMPNEQRKWFVDELLRDYPDVDSLVQKSFSDDFIRMIAYSPSELLSITMLALSRFLAHVQFFGNQLQAEAAKLKREFEGQKYVAISNLDKITDRTPSNIMLSRAYKDNPNLLKLEKELAEKEEKAKFYERMPDRISEHIQVIKYELKRREGR